MGHSASLPKHRAPGTTRNPVCISVPSAFRHTRPSCGVALSQGLSQAGNVQRREKCGKARQVLLVTRHRVQTAELLRPGAADVSLVNLGSYRPNSKSGWRVRGERFPSCWRVLTAPSFTAFAAGESSEEREVGVGHLGSFGFGD
jgi:hypothetical protein